MDDLDLVLKIVEPEKPHCFSEVKLLQIKIQNKRKRKFFTLDGGILNSHCITQAPSLSFKFNRDCQTPITSKGKY
jgi:hypothetical protein